jgi:hypothetical protein
MLTISSHKGNVNQNHTRFHLTLVRIAIIKNTTNHRCWQGCREKEPPYTAGGNAHQHNHSGKKFGGFLKI